MAEIFADKKVLIVFLHVLSAVIWVGGMVAMRFAAHPSFMEIEDAKLKLQRVIEAVQGLFTIVFPFAIILVVTAVFMILGYDLKNTDYNHYAHAKETIWIIMFVNYIVMIMRTSKASKLLESGDIAGAKEKLAPISKFMIPANIVLGIIAIYLGAELSSAL